jgi:hypothetical protein
MELEKEITLEPVKIDKETMEKLRKGEIEETKKMTEENAYLRKLAYIRSSQEFCGDFYR